MTMTQTPTAAAQAYAESGASGAGRRVLIFKETLLPPSETFILAQMRALKKFDARLCGLMRSERSLPLDGSLCLLTDGSGALADLAAKLYRRTGFAPAFHRRAGEFRPHLIHAHFASGGRSALPLAASLSVPLIVTLHGSDVTVRPRRSDQYKELGEKAVLFLCVSNFLREQALAAGFPAEKLLVHFIGIDRSQFAPRIGSGENRGVLFVGRLVEKKGCADLLHTMKRVQKAKRDCLLTIIGDGPERAGLEDLARMLSVRCEFLGVQASAVVRARMQSARIVCVPSVTASNGDTEGLPTVIAEAQATGIPVVATRHAGIPEIVADDENGLLAEEHDHDTMAEAILRLASDDALWARMSAACLVNVAQRFDLIAQTALLEQHYRRALRM